MPVKNSARLSAVVLALTLSLAPAGAQYAFAGPENGSVAVPSIHIDNFGRVDATYYRGAQPKGRDYADLAALGIKTVINLTSDDADTTERTMAAGSGLKYFQIPMTTHRPPMHRWATDGCWRGWAGASCCCASARPLPISAISAWTS